MQNVYNVIQDRIGKSNQASECVKILIFLKITKWFPVNVRLPGRKFNWICLDCFACLACLAFYIAHSTVKTKKTMKPACIFDDREHLKHVEIRTLDGIPRLF